MLFLEVHCFQNTQVSPTNPFKASGEEIVNLYRVFALFWLCLCVFFLSFFFQIADPLLFLVKYKLILSGFGFFFFFFPLSFHLFQISDTGEIQTRATYFSKYSLADTLVICKESLQGEVISRVSVHTFTLTPAKSDLEKSRT